MEEIIKQNEDNTKSHKEFEKLLSQDMGNRKLKEGVCERTNEIWFQ